MSLLPEGFVFNQSNLQDYLICPRRFFLKYIKGIDWPAVQEEPYYVAEQMMMQGNKFHHLLHQFFLGITPELLSHQVIDANLSRWWSGFLDYFKSNISEAVASSEFVYPEFLVFSFIYGFRISAKYDLLLKSKNGDLIIYDWKTIKVKPERHRLFNRMQTRIYPFILMQCLESDRILEFKGAERIRMVYWFSEHPTSSEIFDYSSTQYAIDKKYLLGKIESIIHGNDNKFFLTEDLRQCDFCVYRSYCNRGRSASNFTDTSDIDANSEIEEFDDDFMDSYAS